VLLRAHLDDAVVPADCFDHRLPLADRRGHRFFQVDVLAGRAGIDGHPGVPVRVRSDDHGVDALVIQDSSIIVMDLALPAKLLVNLGQAFAVDVTDRGHANTRQDLAHVRQVLTAVAASDDPDRDGITWLRDCARGLGSR